VAGSMQLVQPPSDWSEHVRYNSILRDSADTAGSFISQFQLSSDGAQGPLTGRSLAVKDMYDVRADITKQYMIAPLLMSSK